MVSNSSALAPFLTYLTVFKARLGIANIVLPLSSFAYQPGATIERQVRNRLSKQVSLRLDDPANFPLFEYLLAKNVVGGAPRESGRYKDYCLVKSGKGYAAQRGHRPIHELPVFEIDIWMSHPDLPSTIGVPTPENTNELLEFCHQFGLLTRTKNTWTAAGQLVVHLRREYSTSAPANPFLLSLEGIALLRQLIDRDGLLIRELMCDLVELPQPISRETISERLESIASRAVLKAEVLRLPAPLITGGKRFVRLLKTTGAKYARSATGEGSRGPGVLEHRASPRLEWLTDMGALSKDGLPKNGFEYRLTSDAGTLLTALDRYEHGPTWADEIAIDFWRRSSRWAALRSTLASATDRATVHEALREGYRLMRRTVGPASIREVCFVAALFRPQDAHPLQWFVDHLLQWATAEPAITLSGGRYTRRPELVHMTSAVLERNL